MGAEDLESYIIIKLDRDLLSRQIDRAEHDRRGASWRPGSGGAAAADASRRSVIAVLIRAAGEADDTLTAIERRIDELEDPRERDVLRRHWIDGQSIPQIAQDLHYEDKTIWIRHMAARRHYHTEDPEIWIKKESARS